ncbi:MAG: metal-dependent transcriptional regulator [Candidatus Latescibacteria bacterium]|nr:metal-dependent transcriptional regulator [Candidatus Latescibacterota bacterium]
MFEEVWRAYEKNELSHSAAHHLMAIHELRHELGYARVSDIAKHLSITKGSVSTTMKHLKERGYVKEDANRFLELTEQGRKVVQETEATRMVVQRFLSDGLGMDEDDAMIDACKVEHLISAEARVRLVCFLRMLFSEKPLANEFLKLFREGALECRSGDVDTCRLCEDVCFGYKVPPVLEIEQ